ncbi:Coiled-coil domain-containing protein 102A [Pseudolycoriella hygida]|uniref:Coiled-coil domain-containing protein 102A n=1 Tax=Pseudolycoriella hygida TaxID=35572 RepID=A0A9Q0S0V6_9DIPT|nr:Coiled-coil domain-containing protein 102A [Pseudolycoriella hygida]
MRIGEKGELYCVNKSIKIDMEKMSQTAPGQSLGAAPRRHQAEHAGAIGTSISARFEAENGNKNFPQKSSNYYPENVQEARESQRQRELDEARARAAQMEKTMKWWSDCTANWREKWSKVRNERNKARDEVKQLRTSLEAALKETNLHKREKSDLELQITQLKREMDKIHMLMMKHAGQFNKGDGVEEAERDGRDNGSPDISSDGLKNVNSEDGLIIKSTNKSNGAEDVDIEEYILQGAIPKHLTEDERCSSAEERRLIQQLSKDNFDEEYLLQKMSMLQLRLDENQKSLQLEREEKNSMHKNLEKLVQELQDTKDKCEELREAKQDAIRELLTLQEQQRAELRIINNALMEETSGRECLERRISELRTELERLQSENAAEWGKRERLETEKLALERDNKKVRAEIRDLQERADRRGRPISNTESEYRNLQQELADKNKEIADIRHSHSKLKKLCAEANTELCHAVRRAEQYETEVKRLRARVEELKRELASAEDELDATCNHVRRLQRTNEELTGQSEGLQVQIQHLQTRHSTSPKKHDLYNPSTSTNSKYPPECKPNINDLRQLFDSSRYEFKRNVSPGQAQSYFDAKTSAADENILDTKIGLSRNIDFERAKQKFDKPTSLRLNKIHQVKTTNYTKSGYSGGMRSSHNDGVGKNVKHSTEGNGQLYESNNSRGSKKDAYMNSSMNLDELKVSEDDDTS